MTPVWARGFLYPGSFITVKAWANKFLLGKRKYTIINLYVVKKTEIFCNVIYGDVPQIQTSEV